MSSIKEDIEMFKDTSVLKSIISLNRKIDANINRADLLRELRNYNKEDIKYLNFRFRLHSLLHSILTGLLILCIIIISSKLIEINDTLDRQLEVNEYLLNRVEFKEVVEDGEFKESKEIS